VRIKYNVLFILIGLVYLIGMFNDVMEVDAAQYATMSREMLEQGNYLQLFDRGQDYLDKPPLLFWVSALSFKIFGISNFTYKLPSVLFSLLGIFATFQLGRRLYNREIGYLAALILASCQAWFMTNNDIRTDTILASCTIVAIWQLFLYLDEQKFIHLVLGSLGVAGAMLTKGPIGIVVPAISIGFYLLVKRDWRNLFNWKWLLLPVLVAICISPFLYGLYQQFDLQPGKIIQGEPIQSGVKFYLWTQSFGRITGESVWKDDTTKLFFTHTFLWAFLPWCLLFLVAFWRDTVQLFKARFHFPNPSSALTWAGFIFPFIAFSLSHYKLPHYIFVVFPLAAIATANFVNHLIEQGSIRSQANFKWIQFFIVTLVFGLGITLCTWAFPLTNLFVWFATGVGVVLSFYLVFKARSAFDQIVLPSALAIIVINFLLNVHIYPTLFQFASTNQAGKYLKARGEENFLLSLEKSNGYALNVYSQRTIPNYGTLSELLQHTTDGSFWIFTTEVGHQEIMQSGLKVLETKKMEHFHISKLTGSFLNPKTREKQIKYRYLMKVETSH
jgi:4-amino-4-deoxy-L-arabinose transferase-like glycosyltransferase